MRFQRSPTQDVGMSDSSEPVSRPQGSLADGSSVLREAEAERPILFRDLYKAREHVL